MIELSASLTLKFGRMIHALAADDTQGKNQDVDSVKESDSQQQVHEEVEDEEEEEEDSAPPASLLSVNDQTNKDRRHSETSDDEDDNPDVSSSIMAIHRPIAARRRTITGEAGEASKNGEYYKQRSRSGTASVDSNDNETIVEEREKEYESSESEDEDEDSKPNQEQEKSKRGPGNNRKRASTGLSQKSVIRKEELSEKLVDIFELHEPEPVVGEFSCWLFRGILLQGYAFLTSGHFCFYAYLNKKEVSRYTTVNHFCS